MCFTGVTADSDEGIDDTACHFVVGKKTKKKSLVSRPGERRLFRSLQTRLCFGDSLKHGCCNYIWLTPCSPPLPSLSPTHCGLVDFYKVFFFFLKGKLMLLQMHVFFVLFLIAGIY